MWKRVGESHWEFTADPEQHYLVLDAPEGDQALLVELHDGTVHVYEPSEPIDPADPLQGAQFVRTHPHDEHTPWLRTCTLIEAEPAMRNAAELSRALEFGGSD